MYKTRFKVNTQVALCWNAQYIKYDWWIGELPIKIVYEKPLKAVALSSQKKITLCDLTKMESKCDAIIKMGII